MRVLLTEGSGLTSRQVATHLDRLGHHVEALTSDKLCLTRFTKHVRRLLGAPAYGNDPLLWLERALEAYHSGGFDLLFCTHEQAAVLAHQASRLTDEGVVTAVPSFAAYAKVFDKCAAQETLTELGIPTPRTMVVRSAGELLGCPSYPVFVKQAVGNSSTGVLYVEDADAMVAVVRQFAADGSFDDGVVVQRRVTGPLVMVQAVFADGEMVAFHTNLREAVGAGGSSAIKRSVRMPHIRAQMQKLGAALEWHGALSADVILRDEQPRWIDVNPRLVEPGNAYRAGVDLVAAYVEVARSGGVGAARSAAGAENGVPGRLTHQLLMAVLGAAERGDGRRRVLRELVNGVRRSGPYAGSEEELLPLAGDLRSAVMPVAVSAALLASPRACKWFTGGATSQYALGAAGWRQLRAMPVAG